MIIPFIVKMTSNWLKTPWAPNAMRIARPQTNGGDMIGRSINVSRMILPLNLLVARRYATGIPKIRVRITTAIEVSRLMMMADKISGDLILFINSFKDVAVRRHANIAAIKKK
jgi:hypothetical protein